MDEFGETDIRTLCCTCLSVDRKLFQLCRIYDGVNNLYWLLSHDLEAYKEGFFKDSTKLFICWECKAFLVRICHFRTQVCAAQKQLSIIEEGRLEMKFQTSLSKLSITQKSSYDHEFYSTRENSNNYIFIDCGIITNNLKTEEDEDDIPLSELQNYSDNDHDGPDTNTDNDTDSEKVKRENGRKETKTSVRTRKRYLNRDRDTYNEKVSSENDRRESKSDRSVKMRKRHLNTENDTDNEKVNSENEIKESKSDISVRIRKRYPIKRKRKTDTNLDEYKKYYATTEMTEEEMLESRERKRQATDYVDAPNKCVSCIEGYKSESNFEKHKTLHVPRRKTSQCPICLLYVSTLEMNEHRDAHYALHCCNFCSFSSSDTLEVLRHLKKGHGMRNVVVPKRFKKGERKTPCTKNPGSRPRMNKAMRDKPTPLGYRCSDCDKYFEEKKQRWAHIQKCHREGFKCGTCGKRFSFKNHLQKHERIHQGPPARTQCPKCGKMIQVALLSTHAKLHEPRASYTCTACNKHFVSRESYEVHLKYTIVHAKIDILKFKCTTCDKGFRTRLELRDHVNFHHLGQTQYKCNSCNKPFSSHKCYVYHVKRIHEGLRDKKDKICQQCGKAFDNKKALREHERIHTGERPLSCEICGATFRQNASLYTHKKRVHNIYPPSRREVQVLEGAADDKYKCDQCEKGYRSRGELRDHMNYQHMGKTQHKCPVCDKPLATRRCITRHVRRAHHGIKENERDKICQQCGKAFRDKKGLREHELIHTGERPLACEVCGCTFRQSASLYTHRKRVHKIYPQKKSVEVLNVDGKG